MSEPMVVRGRRWRGTLDELIDTEREGRRGGPGAVGAVEIHGAGTGTYPSPAPPRRPHPGLVGLNGIVAPVGQPSGPPTSFTPVASTNAGDEPLGAAIWTPIGGNTMSAGSMYQANAGGVLGTSSSAPTALWTPRMGQSATPASNITLGATTASTMIASFSAVPWSWQFTVNIRSLGLAASGATGAGVTARS